MHRIAFLRIKNSQVRHLPTSKHSRTKINIPTAEMGLLLIRSLRICTHFSIKRKILYRQKKRAKGGTFLPLLRPPPLPGRLHQPAIGEVPVAGTSTVSAGSSAVRGSAKGGEVAHALALAHHVLPDRHGRVGARIPVRRIRLGRRRWHRRDGDAEEAHPRWARILRHPGGRAPVSGAVAFLLGGVGEGE